MSNYYRLHFRYKSDCATLFKLVAQLLSFPIGRLWARFMPNYKIFGLELNPGHYTIKEHVLSTIMATVAGGSAYAVSIPIHLSNLYRTLEMCQKTLRFFEGSDL